ncbi:hypothetical protein D3C84_879030 [compost metagenome]
MLIARNHRIQEIVNRIDIRPGTGAHVHIMTFARILKLVEYTLLHAPQHLLLMVCQLQKQLAHDSF